MCQSWSRTLLCTWSNQNTENPEFWERQYQHLYCMIRRPVPGVTCTIEAQPLGQQGMAEFEVVLISLEQLKDSVSDKKKLVVCNLYTRPLRATTTSLSLLPQMCEAQNANTGCPRWTWGASVLPKWTIWRKLRQAEGSALSPLVGNRLLKRDWRLKLLKLQKAYLKWQ